MSAEEMYDSLSVVAADVDYTLDVKPHQVLTERVRRNQVIHKGDDSSKQVITLDGGADEWETILIFTKISESEAGTILNSFTDSAKGDGIANTFKWAHPSDGHTYVVRHASPDLPRGLYPEGRFGYGEIRFYVEGKI